MLPADNLKERVIGQQKINLQMAVLCKGERLILRIQKTLRPITSPIGLRHCGYDTAPHGNRHRVALQPGIQTQ